MSQGGPTAETAVFDLNDTMSTFAILATRLLVESVRAAGFTAEGSSVTCSDSSRPVRVYCVAITEFLYQIN